MKPLYLEVSRDKLSLPVAVAESARKLARLRGVYVTSILHAVSTRSKRRYGRSKYIVVWVEGNHE